MSGAAIDLTVANITASIQNIAISNTGADSIQVSSGTLNIGPNVTVSNAGNDTSVQNHFSGLDISGGTVNISVPAGGTPVVFDNNNQFGIEVRMAGVLNITGVPNANAATNGMGTVVLTTNREANLRFAQTPGGVSAASSIDGLVSVSSPSDGVTIGGGSRIRMRNSVITNNAGNGVTLTNEGGGTPGVNVANIDLGRAGAANLGRNTFQVAGATSNKHAGLCLPFDPPVAPAGPLSAQGNRFAGKDCTVGTPAITIENDCGGVSVDIGATAATVVTDIDVATCVPTKAP
jgi:hypothetical protein